MYEVRKVAEVKGKAEGFENNQRRSLRSGQYKGAPQEPRVVGPEVTGHIIWGQQPHHRHLRGMSTWTSQLWQPGKKHHVGERESFGSGVICGGGNLAYLEECDIVFFTTITLERWLLADPSCDCLNSI